MVNGVDNKPIVMTIIIAINLIIANICTKCSLYDKELLNIMVIEK